MANNVFGVDIQAEGAAAVREAIQQVAREQATRSIRDIIAEQMAASGTQEAAAFNVQINDGPVRQVIAENDEFLNIRVSSSDRVRLEKLNSAAAGR